MKQSVFLLLTMLISVSVFAGDNLPENFFTKTLDNGMEILVIEDNSVPLATIELTVRNGAYTETKEFDGLSHLYEHMFFKANRDYPSQEAFMDKINEMGAIFNGTTSTDRVNYFITLGNHKLEDGLAFMNSAIRYPLFNKEEMEKENLVVDGEFERNESNPTFFLRQDLMKSMYGDLYSRKNTIGNHDTIKMATPEKMTVMQEKYYYPNNTLLSVAGDVAHEDIFALVEAVYGDWEASSFDPHEMWPVPEFPAMEGDNNFMIENDNVRVPYIMMGWHGPDTRNDVKSTYAADVFSFILSQKSSKFNKDFVDSGIAYGGGLSYFTNKYTGPISLTMVPQPEHVEEAYNLIHEHIDMWDDDDYFTDEQLQTAKDMLSIQDSYSREKTSAFLHTVTFWWATADLQYYTNYVENLQAITREDIQNYIRTYIQGKPKSTGFLVQPEMTEGLGISKFFKTN